MKARASLLTRYAHVWPQDTLHRVYLGKAQDLTLDRLNQAATTLAPTQPMQPGQIERREFEYIRHGTLSLITKHGR